MYIKESKLDNIYKVFEDIDEQVLQMSKYINAKPEGEMEDMFSYTCLVDYIPMYNELKGTIPDLEMIMHNVSSQMLAIEEYAAAIEGVTDAQAIQMCQNVLSLYDRLVKGEYPKNYLTHAIVYNLVGAGYDTITIEQPTH